MIFPLYKNKPVFRIPLSPEAKPSLIIDCPLDVAWEGKKCYTSFSFCNRQYGKNLPGARASLICAF